MKKKESTFSLKDQLFNPNKVEYLGGLIKNIYNEFEKENFIAEVIIKFPELELKERIAHISEMLRKYLPDDFCTSVNILIKSLPQFEDNGTLDNNFGDFIFSPYCFFIQQYGCTQEYLDFSLESQGHITAHASAEDSIRYFFNAFEGETFAQMLEWSKSDNYYLRRLASEGSRPKLPWCHNITLDYKKSIEILNNLYTDKSRFVTRSVANHLNDISKVDPTLVIERLKTWKKSGRQEEKEMTFIIGHATRTLIKKGNKEALEFLGYKSHPEIHLEKFILQNNSIDIGDILDFSFDIIVQKTEKLVIDYKIYFLTKSGKLAEKVFKIKKGVFLENTYISKKHSLRLMTTKALYPGEHILEIMINGSSFGKKRFCLKEGGQNNNSGVI